MVFKQKQAYQDILHWYQVPQQYQFLDVFKRWMWTAVLVAAFLQCAFFFTPENIFAVVCVLFCWRLTERVIMTPANLAEYTLSTLIIVGYSITQYCLPIIFTLLEGKALTYNLNLPYRVFIHSALALFVFIIAHYLYVVFRQGWGGKIFNKVWGLLMRFQFFTPPTDFQIWLIGLVGVAGMVVTYLTGNYHDGTAEYRSSFVKFLQGLVPYANAPLFLLLKPLFSSNRIRFSRNTTIKVVLYIFLLLGIGVASNSRGLFMRGLTAIGIAYFVGLLLGKFDYKIFNAKNVFLAIIGLWIITGPLSDLGTAMVIVRSQRSQASGSELLSQTLITYQNKKAIQKHKVDNAEPTEDWDEEYFDNIFLSRFCNLKYNDISLEIAHKLGKVDKNVYQYTVNKFWATFPKPVLDFFNVKVDKLLVSSFSFGDYMYYRSGGENALGAFRTGQFAGTGMAAFGWWYLLILGVGVIPFFFSVDLFVLYLAGNKSTYLSLAGLISITSYFTFFSVSNDSESVINIYMYLIRGWIQSVALYWVVFFVTRKLSF
ncbi:hypothetical protein GCM10027347_31870 [Larkinella harenae]